MLNARVQQSYLQSVPIRGRARHVGVDTARWQPNGEPVSACANEARANQACAIIG
jgi:hypothetical protein